MGYPVCSCVCFNGILQKIPSLNNPPMGCKNLEGTYPSYYKNSNYSSTIQKG